MPLGIFNLVFVAFMALFATGCQKETLEDTKASIQVTDSIPSEQNKYLLLTYSWQFIGEHSKPGYPYLVTGDPMGMYSVWKFNEYDCNFKHLIGPYPVTRLDYEYTWDYNFTSTDSIFVDRYYPMGHMPGTFKWYINMADSTLRLDKDFSYYKFRLIPNDYLASPILTYTRYF